MIVFLEDCCIPSLFSCHFQLSRTRLLLIASLFVDTRLKEVQKAKSDKENVSKLEIKEMKINLY